MKPLNTIPIEDFLEKSRIAIKSNQKNLILTIKEVTDLQNSLSIVMTRLSGKLDEKNQEQGNNIVVKMNGGNF